MDGGALRGRNIPAAAELVLLDGYKGMKEREAAIPAQNMARVPEAIESPVNLYAAEGNEAEAVAWQGKFEAARADQAKANAAGDE